MSLRHYLGMKAFALSLVLLVLGIASATGQTVVAADRTVTAPAPLSEKEPSLEAATAQNGSQASGSEIEHPRIATRPPTPLVRK